MLRRRTCILALAAVLAGVVCLRAPASRAASESGTAAKAAALQGTVASVQGLRVELTVAGEKPAWVKRGAGIKVAGGLGKIVDVGASSVTFNTKKASSLKVGDKLAVEKGTVVPAGC